VNKSFTSALDFCTTPRQTALRRRGSDGSIRKSRDSSILSHHARSRAIDSTSDLHPLRRPSTTTGTARYDMGNTRPRLSRALSSSSPVLARPDPPSEIAESHRTVLAHEVRMALAQPGMFLFSPVLGVCCCSLALSSHPPSRISVCRSRQMIPSLASP
jgi:hypothetical protein